MSFLNIPIKAIQANITTAQATEQMPWYDPTAFPVAPGNPYPTPMLKDYRWRVTMEVQGQNHSSYISRNPGLYNGYDVNVGQWIADTTTGQAWQIISVESKTEVSATVIVQDIYRYNTFRDMSGVGNGGPNAGVFVIFNVSDEGIPEIDPVPSSGISSNFTQNLQSRFEYINLQYDYPLYQEGNSFAINDTIAVNPTNHTFVLADGTYRLVIGRVTSISDTKPGWFTINPVQKIVDFLDYLPGDVGDTIYSSTTVPGGITTTPGGTDLYIKLRNNTSSTTSSIIPDAVTSPGSVFQLNGSDVTVNGTGLLSDITDAVNLVNAQTGVSAVLANTPTSVQTDSGLIASMYGEPVLWASSSPASATINGYTVTFNITSTDAGYTDYARAAQMAQSINASNIPGIVASTPGPLVLMITNTNGGTINIVNTTADINGVNFAGSNSGSGLVLVTSASTTKQINFTAVDARSINFFDVIGTTVTDVGLVSVENGVKACGLYIEQGLRNANSTVVTNLTQLNALSPLIGDTAYVIDSDDGNGNNVGEWSLWLYDGSKWVRTSNQDSASTDAKSLEYTLLSGSPSSINIGKISTGRRITLITVEVDTVFDGTPPTLSIGYSVINPTNPESTADGLMPVGLIDLTVIGTYTTSTDILFGTDTSEGDVEITATYSKTNTNTGSAKIIVSYV
jgi:hypothetical protein